MLEATYPIVGSKEFLVVSIRQPEPDPKSQHNDHRCACRISAPNYEKTFYVYGTDGFQCRWAC